MRTIIPLTIMISLFSCKDKSKRDFINPYEYTKFENHIAPKPYGKIKSIYTYEVNYNLYDYPNITEVDQVRDLFKGTNIVLIKNLAHSVYYFDSLECLVTKVVGYQAKSWEEYQYDSENKIITGKSFTDNKHTLDIVYKTDLRGRIIYEKRTFVDSKEIEREQKCEYEGDIIKRYEFVGGYNWGYERVFDKKGRVIKSYSLQGNKLGEFKRKESKTDSKYLSNSKRDKIEVDGTRRIDNFDKNGKIINSIAYKTKFAKKPYREMFFEYDSYGNLRREEWINLDTGDTTKFIFEIEYDEYGNQTYYARKSNFSAGSILKDIKLDWESFFKNEYY